MEKWKATLEWYKQLMTVDGVAGVAAAAFLTFAGRGTNIVEVPTVIVAYSAIFIFLISVGLSVRAMFLVINCVNPEDVDRFLSRLPNLLSPFYYFVVGLVLFIVAVLWHFVFSAL